MGATVAVTVRFRLHEVLEELERANRPMSQSELSRRSGVSMTTINAMVLNKTKQVSLATLDAICGALGVGPGDLLERDAKRRSRG
jgi:DNA-binding Xre family transcriptional regulator